MVTEEAIKEAGRGWGKLETFYDTKSIKGQTEASEHKTN